MLHANPIYFVFSVLCNKTINKTSINILNCLALIFFLWIIRKGYSEHLEFLPYIHSQRTDVTDQEANVSGAKNKSLCTKSLVILRAFFNNHGHF